MSIKLLGKISTMLLKNIASILSPKVIMLLKAFIVFFKYQSLDYRNLLSCYTPPIPF